MIVEVESSDIVDVSFTLTANHQLKPAQRRVVACWKQIRHDAGGTLCFNGFFDDAEEDVP